MQVSGRNGISSVGLISVACADNTLRGRRMQRNGGGREGNILQELWNGGSSLRLLLSSASSPKMY